MSDTITNYIKIIEKNKDLLQDEEAKLIELSKHGDEKAKERLFCSHLKLVFNIAEKYSTPSLPISDLIQEGVIGLEEAVKHFDPSRGNRFSTVAKWWAGARIRKYARVNMRGFDVPAVTSSRIYRINKSIQKLETSSNQIPSNKEVGEDINLPEKKVEFLRKFLIPFSSLNSSALNTEDTEFSELQDTFPDDRNNARETLIRNDGVAKIKAAISELSLLEQRIIEMRYGLKGESKTLKETRDILFKFKFSTRRFTQERIRQIQEKAEIKLRGAIDK